MSHIAAVVAVATVTAVVLSPGQVAAQMCDDGPSWIALTVELRAIVKGSVVRGAEPSIVPIDPHRLLPAVADPSQFPIGRQTIEACKIETIVQWGSGSRLIVEVSNDAIEPIWAAVYVSESVDAICGALDRCTSTEP